MIGTSVYEYVFICACIFVLHWIAPISTLYCLGSLAFPDSLRVFWILHIWLNLEAVFYILVYHPRKRFLQKAATHVASASRAHRHALFQRCCKSTTDPELYLVKWFMDAPVSEIKRENVKDFFSWAFFNVEERNSEDEEELEEYILEMEGLLGRRIESGRGNAQCFRLSLSEVDMLHRSLCWYMCISFVDLVTSGYMRYNTFRLHSTPLLQMPTVFPFRAQTLFTARRSPAKTLTYWHRPHTSKTRLPVLFIHGIGIGLYPYTSFLADLNSQDKTNGLDGEVGIIAVEIMSISLRITAETLGKEDMCREIDCILEAHGWQQFVMVSHSYGSVIATHLLHASHIAPKIRSIVFVDPVCFLLHLPDVAYNFLCRKPTRANEHLLHYFASKDMGVAHMLFRRFFWSENILWKEDLGNRPVTVVLSGQDLIVNAAAVKAYLMDGGGLESGKTCCREGLKPGGRTDVLWFPELDHGQAFSRKSAREQVVEVTKSYCESG